MKIPRLTTIDLQKEAVANSKARAVRTSLQESARIATRDARAHHLVCGLKPGECLTIASMGELSMHDLAGAVAEQYGPFETLTLSTWAASGIAIQRLVSLRDRNHVRRLEALVDSRCPTDCQEAHGILALSFDLYGTGQNHAKVLAFTGGSPGVAVIATANLTENPRCEVALVFMSDFLAGFHRDWIREVLKNAKHA